MSPDQAFQLSGHRAEVRAVTSRAGVTALRSEGAARPAGLVHLAGALMCVLSAGSPTRDDPLWVVLPVAALAALTGGLLLAGRLVNGWPRRWRSGRGWCSSCS